jgi:putative membrane protein
MIRTFFSAAALRHLLAAALAGLLMATGAVAQSPPSPQDFVKTIAVANMFGVESATLALQKSDSAPIKDYAHRLADAHAKAASSLRRIVAKRSDMALPDRPDSAHLDLLTRLSDRQGADFDSEYVKAQRDSHRQVAQAVAAYARDGSDAEIKAFAADALPVFEKLESDAQQLATVR